jgi:hypothetical protein
MRRTFSPLAVLGFGQPLALQQHHHVLVVHGEVVRRRRRTTRQDRDGMMETAVEA